MTQQQEDLETQRPKRRALGAFLLGLVPLAVAGTAGFAASRLPADTETARTELEPLALTAAAPAVDQTPVAAIVAPGSATEVDLSVGVPKISVSFEPEPEPEPVVAVAAASQASKSNAAAKQQTAKKSDSTKKSSSKKKSNSGSTTMTAAQYCASPSSPVAAGGSVKALLAAANKERARIGAAPLTWNGSLASAAASWSKSMAGKDSAGDGKQLAHNPNRPGAENVAFSSSTAGISTGTAVARAHTNWMYSPGHCQNIMNPAYSSMGAGVASTDNGQAVYTTVNFR
ncbi:CAP domain-containing protein [Demequina sp.]|uniref:CAP domain-containing protein n=1 Tax=Demequina sp. TaxID=2050685 RepID=UPI003A8499D4